MSSGVQTMGDYIPERKEGEESLNKLFANSPSPSRLQSASSLTMVVSWMVRPPSVMRARLEKNIFCAGPFDIPLSARSKSVKRVGIDAFNQVTVMSIMKKLDQLD